MKAALFICSLTVPNSGCKVEVNGPNQSPLYAKLTKTEPAGPVAWNFEKYLVDREGKVVARFHHNTKPESPEVVTAVEWALSS